MKQEAMQKAAAEIEANRDKRGLGAGDKHYFRRHETTSRVHADWDNEESDLKTFSIDDQPHQKGVESDLIGPQMPMHLRTTHKPRESKYAHLTADGETTASRDDKLSSFMCTPRPTIPTVPLASPAARPHRAQIAASAPAPAVRESKSTSSSKSDDSIDDAVSHPPNRATPGPMPPPAPLASIVMRSGGTYFRSSPRRKRRPAAAAPFSPPPPSREESRFFASSRFASSASFSAAAAAACAAASAAPAAPAVDQTPQR